MDVKISNEITITNPSQEIREWCLDNLVIDNPEYIKKERMGFWIGNTPRRLSLYKTNGDTIIVPIGAMKHIKPMLHREGELLTSSIDLADNGVVPYDSRRILDGLYDYQREADGVMNREGFGILQSPAGSGKTQMGVALAALLGKKCLWLTHTHDLLRQSYDRAAQYIDRSLLGIITAGEIHIGAGITFATVQTLSKQDLTQYKYEWDVVIVDECHRAAGTPTSMTQFSKVISNLAARHKYGLSATVHRADGMIKCCYLLLGDVKHIVPDDAVKSRVMPVKIERIDTGCDIPQDAVDTDGTIRFSKLISGLSENMLRNAQIAANMVFEKEHYHLVLSDRLSQLHQIYDALPPSLQKYASIIDGKMTGKKKAAREQAIKDMREGNKNFLLASYKLAKEGLDIPRLDRLHLATPQKDYAIVVQSIGRIARTFEGKDQPICYDYVDAFKMAERMFTQRRRHYNKCGCNIGGKANE